MRPTKIDIPSIRLDPRTQTIAVDGRKTKIQHKAWRVLMEVTAAAPSIVTREQLIETVWSGNFDVGNKALTHAMWTIRHALGDDPKRPRFVKTVAREGYCWIGPTPEIVSEVHPPLVRRLRPWIDDQALQRLAASVIALAAPLLLMQTTKPPVATTIIEARKEDKTYLASTGAKAFFSGQNLIYENLEGCQYVFRARQTTTFGEPIFSEDGLRMAVRANDLSGCKLLILEVDKSNLEIFNTCPSADLEPYFSSTLT